MSIQFATIQRGSIVEPVVRSEQYRFSWGTLYYFELASGEAVFREVKNSFVDSNGDHQFFIDLTEEFEY